MTNYTDSDGLKCSLAKIISYICEAPFLANFSFYYIEFFSKL